jgi:hypothetical protein
MAPRTPHPQLEHHRPALLAVPQRGLESDFTDGPGVHQYPESLFADALHVFPPGGVPGVNPSAFSGTLQGQQESFWISSANESGCILSFKWSGFLLPQNNKKCTPKTQGPARTFARNAPENFT